MDFLPSVPRIPAQGSFFAALHQYAGVGVAAAMIALKVLYRSISRARVAEGTPFFVHVGLPCEIAEMLFGRFSRSILLTDASSRSSRDPALNIAAIATPESLANDSGKRALDGETPSSAASPTAAPPYFVAVSRNHQWPLLSRTFRAQTRVSGSLSRL